MPPHGEERHGGYRDARNTMGGYNSGEDDIIFGDGKASLRETNGTSASTHLGGREPCLEKAGPKRQNLGPGGAEALADSEVGPHTPMWATRPDGRIKLCFLMFDHDYKLERSPRRLSRIAWSLSSEVCIPYYKLACA